MRNSDLLKVLHNKLEVEPSLSPPVCANLIKVVDKYVDRLFEFEATHSHATFIETVDFPDFVSDLIKGVFDAIVDASIQQMEAYTDLLDSVSETVDEFIADVADNSAAADFLSDHYDFEITDAIDNRLVIKNNNACEKLKRILKDLGIDLPIDCPLTEKQIKSILEAVNVRCRQKQLTTMVLMGINRIVGFEGKIK
jgi:hypothetical protein